MAKPQKENGYTPIANEILEHIYKLNLSGIRLRIIMVVWRYTYGFSRKEHKLSVNFILDALELKPSQYKQISREILYLISCKILTEISSPDKNKTRIISFTKDFDLWTNLRSGQNSPLDNLEVTPKKSIEAKPAENGGILPLDKFEVWTKKSSKKNNIYKNKYTTEFELFYSEYPRAEDKNRSFTNWKTQLKNYTSEQLMQSCRNYVKAKQGTEKQYLKSSANFLGKEKVFEDYLVYEDKPKDHYRRG